MKRVMVVTAAVLLIVMSLAFAGCGGSSKSSDKGTTKQAGEADSGVPIYPGASKQDVTNARPVPADGTSGSTPPAGPLGSNGQSSMPAPPTGQPGSNGQSSTPGPGPGGMTMSMYWTPDSTSKVAAWYKQQLSGKSGFAEVTLQNPAGQGQDAASVMYTFKSGDTTKSVMIRENRVDSKGGTSISIGDLPNGAPSSPPANQGQQT
jgi:hypothetical protein